MQKSSRLAGLDTLRSLAIVSVMLYHLNWRLPAAFAFCGKFGWMGVDLFFVLSGYLIGSQLLKPVSRGQTVEILAFYRKRAYRILPAYFTVLALYLLWPAWHEDTGISPLWQFLSFTENLFVDYSRNHAFSHVWSLCVEEHFYFLLPIIVLLLTRKSSLAKSVTVLIALVAFGIAIRSYELFHVLRPIGPDADSFSIRYIERIYYPTYSRLDGLLAGVAIALLKIFRPTRFAAISRHANLLLPTGLAVTGLCVWMFYNRFSSVTGPAAASSIIGFPLLSLGFALMVIAAIEPCCWFSRFQFPGTKTLATLAFSLYLTHKEVAALAAHFLPTLMEARDWRTIPILAFSCLAVAIILYIAIERPFLVLRDHRSKHVDLEARIEPAL